MVHQPKQPNGAGMVLTHGAGGNCRAPLLVAVAEAFSAAGVYVLRYDLPFRQRRPFGPPSPATAAALQFVRKVSGFRAPSKLNQPAFDAAVRDIAETTQRLLDTIRRDKTNPIK